MIGSATENGASARTALRLIVRGLGKIIGAGIGRAGRCARLLRDGLLHMCASASGADDGGGARDKPEMIMGGEKKFI
jgi:hypothetical protein